MAIPRRRIGLRDVKELQPGQIVWDASVPGFGARRQRSAAVAYVLFYRTAEGRQRWMTIGRHGAPWTPDEARDEAKRLLGRIASGQDPAAQKRAKRQAVTVAELCDDYWEAASSGRLLVRGGKPKRPSTLVSDKGRIDGHIRPLLGKLPVAGVTRADIDGFMHAVAARETVNRKKTKVRGVSIVRGGQGVATRSVGLLGAVFSYAVQEGLRPDNPAHGVRKFAEGKRERRLAAKEYKALGCALQAAQQQKVWPPAVAAVEFLAITGWRSGEALSLRGSDLDLDRRIARLQDTKTGASVRPLSTAACDLLREQQLASGLVFPATRGEGRMTGFRKFWDRIVAMAPVPPDISPHTLRHSFASVAADLEYAESTIGALIGHRGNSVTARYVHSADAVLLAAADAIAGRIVDLILGQAESSGSDIQAEDAS